MFKPHDFETKFRVLGGMPKIEISSLAYQKASILVDTADTEVSWLHTVSRTGNIFLVEDTYLLEQTVTMATTGMSAEGVMVFLMEHEDLAGRLLGWGHSHVNMDVSPSGQDDQTVEDMIAGGQCPYFIRGIFNKPGKIRFDLYFPQAGYVLHDVPWSLKLIEPEGMREQLLADMQLLVKQQHFYAGSSYTPGTVSNPGTPRSFYENYKEWWKKRHRIHDKRNEGGFK